ncbi:C3HC zinc finger-like-domain-containing protein [Protomyces lactucae-debilis]|uniref:C3HC zinc finger-like-domain-containing protein n=1 Tax=Protomyces lactucae-debilis TaxID=2754530 RepID=A0A1Y2FSX4_PROLT|nr:C3HC zinc finger-like-domain-containing protein [Protomyces lactucae-debilis]ORY86414.1 C3HC zinc finger-like-domain-containing protein [Protomyces lactucae-debilis]
MSTAAEEQSEKAASESRKRRIDELLNVLDSPKAHDPTVVHKKRSSSVAYNPRSREQLLSRLATFKLYRYHSLASPISAINLSRSGWTLDRRQVDQCSIVCVCCKAMLTFLLGQAKVSAALEKRYAELSVSTHRSDCPWQSKSCSIRLLALKFDNIKKAIEQYEERQNLVSKVSNMVCSLQGLSQADQEGVESLTGPSDCAALLGWSIERQNAVSMARCQDCLRRVLIREEPFKCVQEHYDFCPWINASAQGGEPAWAKLAHILRDQQSINDEAQRSIEPEALGERLQKLKEQLNLKMRVL